MGNVRDGPDLIKVGEPLKARPYGPRMLHGEGWKVESSKGRRKIRRTTPKRQSDRHRGKNSEEQSAQALSTDC